MANLTRVAWPKGWVPSQDRNGDPAGLLRMDNLQQEEDGSLSLVRGLNQIGGDFPNLISDIYTKSIGNEELLYVGLGYGSQVLRADLAYTSAALLISGGGTRPVFGSSLGQVYACSGTQRKKDTGPSGSILDLGLTTPVGKPVPTAISQSVQDFFATYTKEEGSDDSVDNQIYVDQTSLRGVAVADVGSINTLTINGAASDDPAADRFYIDILPEDTEGFKKFRVELYMDDANYYWKEWEIDSGAFALGLAQWSTLNCRRDEFIRQGEDTTFGWGGITRIRVIGEATGYKWFTVDTTKFAGGGQGQLNGLYEYVYVEVNDNGTYVARSGASPKSDPVLVWNGKVQFSLTTADAQATGVQIYRRSVPSGEFRKSLDIRDSGEIIQPLLDDFYLVSLDEDGYDNTSDLEALRIGIKLNQFLLSVKDIDEPFIGIEGLINERMLYLTSSYVYLSDRLNPDAIDSRFTIKVSGDTTEKNLWIKQVSNNVLVLATTRDLYQITGTLLDNPDGSLDANIKGSGEKYPPICADFAFTSLDGVGTVIYIAADGWRATTGSNSILISNPLDKLFQKEERYGVPAIKIYPGDLARYDLAVGRNKLYCISQHDDGTRRLMIYDFQRKTWRLQYIDPVAICVTEEDRIFLGFGGGSGNNIFELEYGDDATVYSDEPEKGQGFNLETVLDHSGQPRNRKDTFTLKLNMDTGDKYVSVYIARNDSQEDSDWVFLGNYKTSGQDTVFISLDESTVTLGFRYAIRITNKDLTIRRFRLFEVTIEYDPRPEQNTYFRIPNTNQGSYARKRWTSYAFVIDTLGGNVTFTPLVDNVAQTSSVVAKSTKLTNIHFFDAETIGTDIGGVLEANQPFEFYGINLEETVSEKLPTPVKFLVIPAEDYGSPNRKRHTSYKFQINTRGQDVRFTPKIDGIEYDPQTFNTTEKRTVEYFFWEHHEEPDGVYGIDIGGTLESLDDTEFEFYGVIRPQEIDLMPPRLREFWIPQNNFGTPSRKRFTSLKMIIDTGGDDVIFTPYVDGVAYETETFNTTGKRVVEYFFNTSLDVKGIDIAGHFKTAVEGGAFEFYSVVVPEKVESLPSRLKSLYLPNENLGVAAKKRIRTIPLIIDTGGYDVTYTPTIDGVAYPAATFNTSRKQTVLYYFVSDAFGIDIGGKLTGVQPFEFYGFGQFENVEVLPVGKKFDQLQSFRMDKVGKLFSFRTRLIATGTSIDYTIYGEGETVGSGYPATPLYSGTLSTVPDVDEIYEVDIPKNVNGRIFRIVLGPADVFHRYDMWLKVAMSGMATDNKWVPLR